MYSAWHKKTDCQNQILMPFGKSILAMAYFLSMYVSQKYQGTFPHMLGGLSGL